VPSISGAIGANLPVVPGGPVAVESSLSRVKPAHTLHRPAPIRSCNIVGGFICITVKIGKWGGKAF